MEAIAYELAEQGTSYSDIAMVALDLDCSFEDAMLAVWLKG